MTITIFGVTGHLGQLIAKHILLRSSTEIIHGVCRDPSKLGKELSHHSRLKTFQALLDNENEIRTALRGADLAIFSALGDFEFMAVAQKRVIDACIAEGVPRYMAGDWSMDFRKLEYGDHPAKDPMKTTSQYLEEKENETGGKIKGVHVLNACFMEAPWVGLYDSKDRCLQFWGTGEEKWELTTYDDAAKFSAAIALDKEANGWFSVRGDYISVPQMGPIFEDVFGFKPSVSRLGSLSDLYEAMHATRTKQPDNVWAWLPMFYTYYSLNGQTRLPQPLSNSRYPDIEAASVKDYFRAVQSPERLGIAYDEA